VTTWQVAKAFMFGNRRSRLAARESGRCRRMLEAISALALTLSIVGGCYPPASARLTCDDVDPPGSFDYGALEQLVALDQLGGKGCIAAPCHSAATQRAGVRLDTPGLVYDELSSSPEKYYELLASGVMPHDGEPWNDDELKIFRSWYCAGAFPP
jgi:hypothetical protein